MRIKFTDTGEECQISGINPDPKNTVCAGRYVARHGKLYEGVEDITQYKTVLVDGVKTKVEVLPEEMKPDSTWLVADIKLWLDAQRIPYVGNASKTDLLALV
jgi:hypothetical protein